MATTLNLSNLSNYINELNMDIVSQAVLTSNFISRIPHMPNIPGVGEYINGFDSTVVFKNVNCDGDTDITGSNTETPIRNLLTIKQMGNQSVICLDALDNTFWGTQTKAGGATGDLTGKFAEVFMADKAKKIPSMIEQILLMDSTSTGTFSTATPALSLGLLHQCVISASASVTQVGLTNSYTPSTAISIVDQVVTKLITTRPELLTEPDLELYMSLADYSIYFDALNAQNRFHFNPYDASGNRVWEIDYQGAANIKIVALHNLLPTNGKKYFILTPKSNLRFGYDSLTDMNNYEAWYDANSRATKYRFVCKIGLGVARYPYIIFGQTN